MEARVGNNSTTILELYSITRARSNMSGPKRIHMLLSHINVRCTVTQRIVAVKSTGRSAARDECRLLTIDAWQHSLATTGDVDVVRTHTHGYVNLLRFKLMAQTGSKLSESSSSSSRVRPAGVYVCVCI